MDGWKLFFISVLVLAKSKSMLKRIGCIMLSSMRQNRNRLVWLAQEIHLHDLRILFLKRWEQVKIHQRGVQWKQGVVIYMILCTSFII